MRVSHWTPSKALKNYISTLISNALFFQWRNTIVEHISGTKRWTCQIWVIVYEWFKHFPVVKQRLLFQLGWGNATWCLGHVKRQCYFMNSVGWCYHSSFHTSTASCCWLVSRYFAGLNDLMLSGCRAEFGMSGQIWLTAAVSPLQYPEK